MALLRFLFAAASVSGLHLEVDTTPVCKCETFKDHKIQWIVEYMTLGNLFDTEGEYSPATFGSTWEGGPSREVMLYETPNTAERLNSRMAFEIYKGAKTTSVILRDTRDSQAPLQDTMLRYSTTHESLLKHPCFNKNVSQDVFQDVSCKISTEDVDAVYRRWRQYSKALPLYRITGTSDLRYITDPATGRDVDTFLRAIHEVEKNTTPTCVKLALGVMKDEMMMKVMPLCDHTTKDDECDEHNKKKEWKMPCRMAQDMITRKMIFQDVMPKCSSKTLEEHISSQKK